MEQIRSYLFTVCVTAVLCSVVLLLQDKKSIHNTIIKILCGIFVSVAVLSPIVEIRFDVLEWITDEYIDEGKRIAANAQEEVWEALSAGIIQQTESYIFNKADALSGDIQVTVELHDENDLQPWRVFLSGSISPYGKRVLSDYIHKDLGIPKERQVWR